VCSASIRCSLISEGAHGGLAPIHDHHRSRQILVRQRDMSDPSYCGGTIQEDARDVNEPLTL